jgi:hypothetical protein
VFFIVDDTSCKKDPSTKRIEGLDYHFAHDDGKSVWSHCIVTAHRVSENYFFACDFRPSDLDSVTVVKQGPCWIYEYKGPLADTENVKVLLSWENEFDSSKKPFCILCTDKSLDFVTILRYDQVRWNIETRYRYFKELLGFDQYQIQSY